MSTTNTTNWIRAGLLALPLSGALTFWSSLHPQPNPAEDYEAYTRFATTTHHLLSHLLGSALGLILAVFGVFALAAYLTRSRSGRMGLEAMVMTVLGSALFLLVVGDSTFGGPALARAYLAGNLASMEEAQQATGGIIALGKLATYGLVILLSSVGNVLLGIAVWRSGTLPKWAGAIWAASALLMYPLGLVVAITITGNTPRTVPVAALLVAISGAWMAWSAMRRPSAEAVGVGAQLKVQ